MKRVHKEVLWSSFETGCVRYNKISSSWMDICRSWVWPNADRGAWARRPPCRGPGGLMMMIMMVMMIIMIMTMTRCRPGEIPSAVLPSQSRRRSTASASYLLPVSTPVLLISNRSRVEGRDWSFLFLVSDS